VYFNFTVKINIPNRKKTYNIDEKRVVNMNRDWICRKNILSVGIFYNSNNDNFKEITEGR
jgi:hypothetical protein